jgi:hypothetical protein
VFISRTRLLLKLASNYMFLFFSSFKTMLFMQCVHKEIQSMEAIHFRIIAIEVTCSRIAGFVDFVSTNISNSKQREFSSYLEFRTFNKVHKPSNSECHTPSSKPFRF